MRMLKELLFPLFKIEATSPRIPYGHEHDVYLRVLRADTSYWRFQLLAWGVYAVAWLFGTIVPTIIVLLTVPAFLWLMVPIIIFVITKALFLLVISRIDYELRWYIITDSSITVRQGAWVVREITVSYQNVQNVKVTQGPVERLLGFANVLIETAGNAGSAQHGKNVNPNLPILRGIVNAQEVRDVILAKLRAFRNAGLGDPDDATLEHVAHQSSASVQHSKTTLLEEIATEATALRKAAEKAQTIQG